MRQIIFTMTLLLSSSLAGLAAPLDASKVKAFELQLEDVMEIIDTTLLKSKLVEVEEALAKDRSELNRVRLGIIYHEAALNFSFLSKQGFDQHAEKSFDILNELFEDEATTPEVLPFVTAYRASAEALWAGKSRNMKLLSKAFEHFSEAVERYAEVSYCPEFMRGSVAENLPWFLFSKTKYAKRDMESIIEKQEKDPSYANDKIMSFTYWAWANQRQGRRYREQALRYLERAIALDPNYEGGRKRAEELKAKLSG